MKNKIYVVTHKAFALSETLKQKGYEIITVGSNCCKNDGIRDSDGDDTIANKNANYCELTAMYWIWKNVSGEIKGFCHYRRFFTWPTLRYNEKKIVDIEDVLNILVEDPKAIILPERKYYNVSARELYLQCGREKDLETTRSVIAEKYPAYLMEYDSMLKGNTGYITNMMIANSKVYDDYCKWLFDILFEVERRTSLNGYSKEEARIYGYISERLLDIWVQHNKLRPVEFQSINSEKDTGIRFLVYRLIHRLGFYKMVKTIMWKARR